MNTLASHCKSLLLSLLIAAFLGQSLAAAASVCAMATGQPAPAMDHHEHAGHAMPAPAAEPAPDCCDAGSFCAMQHCAVLLAMPAPSPQAQAIAGGLRLQHPDANVPSTPPATPYIPPILA